MGYHLLTGATGLLGSYLLRDGLRAGLRLAALVRPGRIESARQRIENILARSEREIGFALPRPVILEGDVSRENLGLGPSELDWVARHCHVVIHNAASLSFEPADRQSEPWLSNLEGTRQVLQVCRRAGIRQLHHVSTAYVAGLREGRILESELDEGQQLGNDYERSKLEAEKLVRAADFIDQRTVYRPAIIVGDSRTAYTTTFHGFYTPLKIVHALLSKIEADDIYAEPLMTGLGLGGQERKNFVPVDWVAAVMVYLMLHPEHHGKTYHLTPREAVPVSLVCEVMEKVVHSFAKQLQTAQTDWEVFFGSVDVFREQMDVYKAYFRGDPQFDAGNTRAAAPHLPCPDVDADMLTRLSRYALEANFGWPRPQPIKADFDVAEHLHGLIESCAAFLGFARAAGVPGLAGQRRGGRTVEIRARKRSADRRRGRPSFSRRRHLLHEFEDLPAACQPYAVGCPGNRRRTDLDRGRRRRNRPPGRHPSGGCGDVPWLANLSQERQLMATLVETTNIPLAIIGMSCRLPGAKNLDEFWRMLVEGRCAVAKLPPDYLDWELYYDPRQGIRGKTYSQLAATLSDKHFDRQSCPVPEELVQTADICHLLMCETAANACRHAGLDPFNLPLRNAGVFIGHAQGSSLGAEQTYATCVEEAAEFLREVDTLGNLPRHAQDAVIGQLIQRVRAKLPEDPQGVVKDLSISMVAGAVAKAFGLSGPFVAVNSACASSLQAMLLAARALQLGRIDMAIVGGCSDFKGDTLILFAQAQAMSATGSRPFDDTADGLVLAEGYAAVVMKTLQRALADGDPIQAVVRGLGVASDGRGKSLWAPRKEGQMEAMRQAYRGGVEMSELQYLEAHATATQLGDATEVGAVAEVLKKCLPPGKKIPISSLKANVGHLLETAGLAGLIKTVLCIQKRTFPPAANLRTLNTKIEWEKIPVYVPMSPAPWPDPPAGKPRRAGVNAFGIGGLNMHVVIDEFTESARRLVAVPPAAPDRKPAARTRDDAVAIIGMGCVLPGARNVAAYWDLLVSARDARCAAPPGRWRPDLAYQPGSRERFHTPTSLGGYITDFQYDWRRAKCRRSNWPRPIPCNSCCWTPPTRPCRMRAWISDPLTASEPAWWWARNSAAISSGNCSWACGSPS